MPLADTYRRKLGELAADQYGFVTTQDARRLGVPPVELRKLAQRGGLDHVAYGLYRFADVPVTARDEFMQAVLRVGPDAYLTLDSVLAFHDLGLVNPKRIRIGTPHRVRAELPKTIEVIQRHLPASDITTYEGVPSTTVKRALLDCQQLVMRDRLVEATREAARRGLMRSSDIARLLREFGAVA